MSGPKCGWWSYAKYMARCWPDRLSENEYAAVAAALAETEGYKNSAERLAVIRMVLLEGSATLEAAALRVPCSESTAQRFHADFLRAVGRHFNCTGLPEEEKRVEATPDVITMTSRPEEPCDQGEKTKNDLK